MRHRRQAEALALAVVDAVKAGRRVEDSRVELKSKWPEPIAAARRLAAHANSARGEDILWIVGIDEQRGVVPVDDDDLATWWAQVSSCFNDTAPSLEDFVLHADDGLLHVLSFGTHASPYVVKNAAYGKSGGGCVELEVPWRDGTAVRSARRSDLIRMIAPLAPLPDIEVLSASASLKPPTRLEGGTMPAPDSEDGQMKWYLSLELYVMPAIGTYSVLPVHRSTIELALDGSGYHDAGSDNIGMSAPSSHSFGRGGFEVVSDSVSVQSTSSEAVVHLPGRLKIYSNYAEPFRSVSNDARIRVRFTVTPVHVDRAIQLEIHLVPVVSNEPRTMEWRLDESTATPV